MGRKKEKLSDIIESNGKNSEQDKSLDLNLLETDYKTINVKEPEHIPSYEEIKVIIPDSGVPGFIDGNYRVLKEEELSGKILATVSDLRSGTKLIRIILNDKIFSVDKKYIKQL